MTVIFTQSHRTAEISFASYACSTNTVKVILYIINMQYII